MRFKIAYDIFLLVAFAGQSVTVSVTVPAVLATKDYDFMRTGVKATGETNCCIHSYRRSHLDKNVTGANIAGKQGL
jgi:hypothetical protein